MKLRIFLLLVLSMATQMLWSANTRLLILRPTSSVTHQWEYMPSGDAVTQQGLKSKQYPLMQLPDVKYMQSELINIEGCDMGLRVRYYVSTKSTHAIKVELVDEKDAIIYSFTNEDPQLNESTMSIGDLAEIGIIDGATKARIRVSLSDAYSADEAIHVDEIELYSKNGAGVGHLSSTMLNISVEKNAIVINSDKDTYVKIYSLSGSCVKNNAICVGTNRIEISSGIYLLNLDGKIYKIIVP